MTDTDNKIAEEVAEVLLKSGAVLLRPKEPFRFTSGILSPIYCDNRLLLSKVEEREKIVSCFIEKATEKKVEADIIAGIATASISWAALVAGKLKKPMIYIRKEAKQHGMKNLVEGNLEKGKDVLVVEDLISTGSTSLGAVVAAREAGGAVNRCLAIFTYEMRVATEGFKQLKCELLTLSNFTTLVRVAAQKGYIKKDDLDAMTEWSKDPATWGRKMGLEQ
ncbi:orotate phosphoribosyltransferase [Candidatus Woesearchaeota archaeon]|nr:orotate phosphoribosyltransferase [Candidatus Woesearchaeota archaeon]